MQQVISGLTACQRTIEKLQEFVQSSNERTEELTDKVNALENELKTDHVLEANQSTSGGGRGGRRKRSTSSLVVQVSMLFYYLATYRYIWRSVFVRMCTS